MISGIPNTGNSCFMNSSWQLIIPIFKDYFLSNEYKENCKNKKHIEFLDLFKQFIIQMQKNNIQQVHRFLILIRKHLSTTNECKRFINRQPADSAEFFIEFVDLLSTYMKYEVHIHIKKHIPENILDKKDKQRLRLYKKIQKNNNAMSIVDELLQGYTRTTIECGFNDCHHFSEIFESFYTLSLPISSSDSLETSLEELVKPVQLDQSNMWYCEQCKRKSQAIKKTTIWNTGEYIIICYKRYQYTMKGLVKNQKNIQTPFDINIEKYTEDNIYNNYEVVGINFHKGNFHNGHYIAIQKIENTWFVCNDSQVHAIEKKNIPIHTAYYLVLKRKL